MHRDRYAHGIGQGIGVVGGEDTGKAMVGRCTASTSKAIHAPWLSWPGYQVCVLNDDGPVEDFEDKLEE
jgi:hypothetical protein